MKGLLDSLPELDDRFEKMANDRQMQLTKPPGALGDLEGLAVKLARLQQTESPNVNKPHISIFAADHGIVEEGVSAFPQEVTQQMVFNFIHGGAAISVAAKALNATLEVIDVGVKEPLPEQSGLVVHRAGEGTANSLKQAAMTQEQLEIAFKSGQEAVSRAVAQNADLFIGGEMGIGNTTPAAILYSVLLDKHAEDVVGAGTGLDDKGVQHKISIVDAVLKKHQEAGGDLIEWLRCAGGFEIAALTSAYITAAQRKIPVLVDGYISSVAALLAIKLQPELKDRLIFSHVSAEKGHQSFLDEIGQKPLLNLGMRLGEGSGAAVAVPLLQMACQLHNNMATFEEAAVAGKL